MPDEKTEQQLATEAKTYLDSKDYPSAAAAYEQLLTATGDDELTKESFLNSIIQWGYDLAVNGQHQEAVEVFEKAVDHHIEAADLFINLGMECSRLSLKDKAAE